MKAHIVGGGFGGLAAAFFLIRNAEVPGQGITIYEADRQIGGGLFLTGGPRTGYNMPGSVFDREFRCAFELLRSIPSAEDPSVSVTDAFFAFNDQNPFNDRAHILDRNLNIVHGPRYGLSLGDAFALARVSLTPEPRLDGRRIDEFFRPGFFATEFWLLWSTIMGSLPQSSAVEFRRYMNRFLYLFPDLSTMRHVLRTPINQHQALIEPLLAWLRARSVTVRTGAFVLDVGFAASGRLTVDRLEIEQDGITSSVAVDPGDIVLVTLGSQAEDLSAGTITEPPPPNRAGRASTLWQRLAQAHPGFGNPARFFGADQISDSRWVIFTVTTTGAEFIEQLSKLTNSEPGLGGLVTLKDSSWLLTLTIFHQPEVIGQPSGTYLWWGYGLYPERTGDFIKKPMNACTGAEILEEALRHLRFDQLLDRVMADSICIPCDLPYVNNIWLPRRSTDRPPVVPQGATNLGLIGQYIELPRDIAFTIEYSARGAWEAIRLLLKRGPAPPPVYQGQYDPKALLAALRVFLGL
jgi:oleate hydratase